MAETVNLKLALMEAASTNKSLDYNEAMQVIDVLLAGAVVDHLLTAPPGSPAEGAGYAVPASATGAWAAHDGDIAIFVGGGWLFVTPKDGVVYRDQTNGLDIARSGAAWEAVATRNQNHSVETANYTLTAADTFGATVIGMNSATALDVTVPPGLEPGQPVTFYRYGAGAVTFVAGAGVTIRSSAGALSIGAQYSAASLISLGADEYLLVGDLS